MTFEPGHIYSTDMGGGFRLIQFAVNGTHGWNVMVDDCGMAQGLTNFAKLSTQNRPTVELVPATQAQEIAA